MTTLKLLIGGMDHIDPYIFEKLEQISSALKYTLYPGNYFSVDVMRILGPSFIEEGNGGSIYEFTSLKMDFHGARTEYLKS